LDLSFLEKKILPGELSEQEKQGFLKDFHEHRRNLIQLRSIMNRICVVASNDARKLRVSGESIPNIQNAFKFFQQNFVESREAEIEKFKRETMYSPDHIKSQSRTLGFDEKVEKKQGKSDSFFKDDRLLPLSFVLKLHSMDELEKKGVNLEFVYDRIKRKDVEDDRKEVFNTRKFQERFEDNVTHEERLTDWTFFNNDVDFDDLGLEEKSLKKLMVEEMEKNQEQKVVEKNAKISNRKMIYPLIGSWPPTNALVYKGIHFYVFFL
jgi:hypothetical protein